MPRSFWLTNRLANPVLRRVLRSPAGHRLGRQLAVIRYRGRRTGKAHELVVGYRREASTAWVVVGFPERKVWWRNLRTPGAVEVWLAGQHHRATAVVVEEGSAVRVRVDLEAEPDDGDPQSLSGSGR